MLMCEAPGEIKEEEHHEARKDNEPKRIYPPCHPPNEGAVKLKDYRV